MKSHVLVNFDNNIAKVDRLAFPEEIGETFMKKSWKLLCYPDYSENQINREESSCPYINNETIKT